MRTRAAVIAVIAAAAAFGAAQAASPTTPEQILGGDPNVKLEYFEVTGVAPRTLQKEIFEKGPAKETGMKRAAGVTRTRLSYSWLEGPDGCDPASTKVSYEIIVRVPKLAPGMRLKNDVGEWWMRMSHNLAIHELDHVKLAIGFAKKAEDAMRAAPTCEAAREAAETVIAEMNEAQARYDMLTNHGTRLAPKPLVRKSAK